MKNTGDPLPQGIEIGALSRIIRHHFADRIEQVIHPLGLTLGQWTVLRELKRTPGASASELARAAVHTPQAVSRLIRSLQEEGLVERSPARGRVVDNHLTAKGHKVMDDTFTQIEAQLAPLLDKFGSANVEEFRRLAHLLIQALEDPA
ncbi:MarR family winged helix-turn-helix transcriptional regulator [Streptomyces varsoviensis]|uniref:MarR family winged helix-turn-helix transcriptional regulator n=1 Tax=Streptomyces varsoviensis TaxID=67373 RepID=UPI0006628B3F|nr:MarR family winged helix-turn-helix transcriptional regulator [Streptomyces varsoviensis]